MARCATTEEVAQVVRDYREQGIPVVGHGRAVPLQGSRRPMPVASKKAETADRACARSISAGVHAASVHEL